MLAALRGVLKEAWRLGQMDAETYQRASDLRNVRSERLPTGRALTKRELQKLFRACSKSAGPIGARDAALISVLYGGGLRRSEAVSLDLEDYNPETGELRIRAGKGRKERTVYARNGSKDALEAWLTVRGDEAGPLFWPADGRGRKLVNRRMSDQAVRLMLMRRAKQARISQHFSPHDLRRTFVSDLLEAGADMSVVQGMAGHSSIDTTARYDRRGEEAKRRAAELLHVPYKEQE
jgi:site-specific recombinase XerD